MTKTTELAGNDAFNFGRTLWMEGWEELLPDGIEQGNPEGNPSMGPVVRGKLTVTITFERVSG